MGKLNFKGAGKRILNRAGGGIAGGAVGYGVDKLLSGVGPWGRIGIKAGVGALLPELMPKNEFVQYAGAGLVGCATQDTAHHTIGGSTSGVGNSGDEKEYVVDVDTEDEVSGPQDSAMGSEEDPSEHAMGEHEEEEDFGQ